MRSERDEGRGEREKVVKAVADFWSHKRRRKKEKIERN